MNGIQIAHGDKKKRKLPLPPLPGALEEAALVDAVTAAATGGMRRSWWLNEVASGRAPAPAIRSKRCTRWRVADVRDYWLNRARAGAEQ